MSRTNWNFARARQNAWGAAELPPSGTSGPTPPTPAPARFARALVLGADHRARPSVARGRQGGWQVPRVWKPLRVSITTRGEPPSFARRGPSRAAERSEGAAGRVAGAAGLETL